MKANQSLLCACVGLVIAVTAACAGARLDSTKAPDRISELEQRVSRLEQRLVQDAGASLGNVNHPSLATSGASDASVSHDDADPACVQDAERKCRGQREQRHGAGLYADGGRSWISEDPGLPANATEAGRLCLLNELARCREERHLQRHRSDRIAWLDAQLTPDRIDQAFSDKVKKRLDAMHARSGPFVVTCTAQFCRIRSVQDAGTLRASIAIQESEEHPGTGGELISGNNGYDYFTRSGFRFPE